MRLRHVSWLLLSCIAVSACKREAEPAALPTPIDAPAAKVATPAKPAEADMPVAKKIPSLRVATIDGKTFDLADQRGKWTVVNFWATWCGPCLKEMPELSALDAMREHIMVVGLAYEDTTVEDMQAFLKQHPVVYPIALLDVYNPPKDFDTPRGLPMTVLVGPDGKVVKTITGPVTAHDIETAIAAAGGPKAG
ncbi:TlpA disulfide reductase family protein [Thermomonas sp.]|uniref:TlpA family protein disulfide reductase n=1 Tax=Thermomonas sp. TaxID=1971895 RepID=UPI002487A4C4|nr:TlpA disulfide reductase family protein [Thermomonas sp.]MDI1254438.1 TlpA disulfide reductase family protein [Thermomonas sp.]